MDNVLLVGTRQAVMAAWARLLAVFHHFNISYHDLLMGQHLTYRTAEEVARKNNGFWPSRNLFSRAKMVSMPEKNPKKAPF